MQCPHCAHPDSIRYGTIRGVRDNRAKKISMLAPASGGLDLWQGPRICLWKKDDQIW